MRVPIAIICPIVLFLCISVSVKAEEITDNETPKLKGNVSSVTGMDKLRLGLKDFLTLVKAKNERIEVQQLEWQVSNEAVKNAESIFETELVGSAQHESIREDYTIQELNKYFFQTGQTYIREENEAYNAAIEQRLPTGGVLRMGYTLNVLENEYNKDAGDEFKTFVGASIEHPLMKNAGIDVTKANIQVAAADSEMEFQAYRSQMLRVITQGAVTYWDLYLAQEKAKIRQASIKIANQILMDNKERVKAGKMPESEIMEAKAALYVRQSYEIAAQQDLTAALNNIWTLISTSTFEDCPDIELLDLPNIDRPVPDENDSLKIAFDLRPEYLSVLKKLDRENVRIVYAKNQRLPQIDLQGSYGLNGLDYSTSDSWEDAFDNNSPSWSMGVQMRFYLGGGQKSKSELNAAQYRKKQALLEIKALETAFANDIDTAVNNVRSTIEQARHFDNVRKLNRQIFEIELKRLEFGKSNSRIVFDKDEALIRAREAAQESLINHEKAFLELALTEGSLLNKFGIDVAEPEAKSDDK